MYRNFIIYRRNYHNVRNSLGLKLVHYLAAADFVIPPLNMINQYSGAANND